MMMMMIIIVIISKAFYKAQERLRATSALCRQQNMAFWGMR